MHKNCIICEETLPALELSEFINMAFHKYFPDRDFHDPIYKIFSRMLQDAGKAHYLEQVKMLLQPWSLNVTAHARHPILIVGGALDRHALQKNHEFMATQLCASVLYLVSHARHFVTIEQPDIVNDIL